MVFKEERESDRTLTESDRDVDIFVAVFPPPLLW